MDRDEIIATLTDLGARLSASGVQGEMYVVGCAAMALAYNVAKVTRDIDAVFEPKVVIYEAAAEISRERGLPPGWLNDAVKGFLAPDAAQTQILDVPGLRVSVASARMLLALKVLAHRVGEDESDVKHLAELLGLVTAASVLAIAEEIFGDRLTPAARFFVEELMGESAR